MSDETRRELADKWWVWKVLAQGFGPGSPEARRGYDEYAAACDAAGLLPHQRGN